MDNLTHTAIGLFLSRAGLREWTPRATPILLVAANAPDADVLSALGGPAAYLHYHRYLTHSLAAMPLMAAAVVLAVRLAGRRPLSWGKAFCAAMIGVGSHLLLDWTNPYGIRLLAPFSDAWLRLDATSVIDLWIWGVALAGVLAPLLARLVGSEITSGALRPRRHGRPAALAALAFVVLYDCGRGVLHARALATLQARIYQGVAPVRAAALPGAANPLRWRGVVETRDAFALDEIDLTRNFDPLRATFYEKPDPSPALEAARRTALFREFLRFSELPLWRVLPVAEPQNGRQVDAIDLRFGTPAEPAFMASAIVDAGLRIVHTDFQFGPGRFTKAD